MKSRVFAQKSTVCLLWFHTNSGKILWNKIKGFFAKNSCCFWLRALFCIIKWHRFIYDKSKKIILNKLISLIYLMIQNKFLAKKWLRWNGVKISFFEKSKSTLHLTFRDLKSLKSVKFAKNCWFPISTMIFFKNLLF